MYLLRYVPIEIAVVGSMNAGDRGYVSYLICSNPDLACDVAQKIKDLQRSASVLR